jgi:hypothetical protein
MASRPPQGPFILYVTFEPRDDGGLRAYCDQVPGFILSHQNAKLVEADVEPALSFILSEMYDQPMEVRRATAFGEDDVFTPIMPAHLCGTQYVGLSRHN